MQFLIVIEPRTKRTAWRVVVPDLPGCSAAGHTMDKAIDNARVAIERFCKILTEEGKPLPEAKLLPEHNANPAYKGWLFLAVEANVDGRLDAPSDGATTKSATFMDAHSAGVEVARRKRDEILQNEKAGGKKLSRYMRLQQESIARLEKNIREAGGWFRAQRAAEQAAATAASIAEFRRLREAGPGPTQPAQQPEQSQPPEDADHDGDKQP